MSEKNMQDMIDAWQKDSHQSRYNDLGFQVKGDASKIYWLSYSYQKAELKLDIKWLDEKLKIADSQYLLSSLNAKKKDILNEVKQIKSSPIIV